MVKCLGICFSLCCALCSPPQRTHGGSNMAVTTKKETNPHMIKKKQQVQSRLSKYFIVCPLYLIYDFTKKTPPKKPSSTPNNLTLNSSLKSLPSSAERIRYSSSSESRGIGKYLLDGEGDLGRRTTVCSPEYKGIYGGQTENVSQWTALQDLAAPAQTSLMTIKISYLCGYMTEMISGVIKLVLRLKTISARNLAFPHIYFPLEEKFMWLPTCYET